MRTRMISVVGSGGTLDPALAALAEDLGAALVKEGFGIVCGGRGGVMEAALRGAVRARKKAQHPPLIGVLPGYDPADANDYVDVALPTGLGHARNAVVAAAGDAVVCVGGATGALSEVALARKIGRPVFALATSGGTATLVAKAMESVQAVADVRDLLAHLRQTLPS